jgi:hypothetical protein
MAGEGRRHFIAPQRVDGIRFLLVSAFRVGCRCPSSFAFSWVFILKAKKLHRIRAMRRGVHDVKGRKELTFLGTNYALTNYALAERLRDSDSTTSMYIAGRNY